LDADALPDALELRTRLRGDQFAPLGMDGHTQKLSDFMVNEKIPQRARDHWPLLCSGRLVIWVPGYRPAHPFRLKESTHNVLCFSVARPAGQIEP
jgi:tRNA(Ile)-lysidine synthase